MILKDQMIVMIELEQKVKKSARNRTCADCGDPGTVKQASGLIKSVSHYWFCQECADYWNGRES